MHRKILRDYVFSTLTHTHIYIYMYIYIHIYYISFNCYDSNSTQKVKSALSSLIFACLFPSSLLVYLRHIPGKWLIRGWWMVCWNCNIYIYMYIYIYITILLFSGLKKNTMAVFSSRIGFKDWKYTFWALGLSYGFDQSRLRLLQF